MKHIIQFCCIAALSVLVLSGCRKYNNLSNPHGSFTSNYLGPIAFANFKAYDLITVKGKFSENANKVVIISTEANKVLFSPTSVPSIPDIPAITYFDTVSLGNTLWKNVSEADFDIDSARVGLDVLNGYDKDFKIEFNRVFSISDRGLPKMDLVAADGFQNPFVINHATNAAGTLTTIKYTEANSNICQVLSKNFAKSIVIQGAFSTINGRTGASMGPAGLQVRAFLDIPMSTWIRKTVANDTFDVKLPGADTLSTNFLAGNDKYNVRADSGMLTIKFDNQFPAEFTSYIYLMDVNNVVLDSLHRDANGLKMTAGIVGANDRVSLEQRGMGSFQVPLTTALAGHLNRTVRAICVVRGHTYNSTTPNNYVRIYSDYSLNVRIIGDLSLTQTFTGK